MSLTKVTSEMVTYDQGGTGSVERNLAGRLQDRTSVFDFMTTAQITDVEGNTSNVDVTSAVQAAIDYANTNGKILYIPAGTYKITSQLTKASSFTMPTIIGAGRKYTIFDYSSFSGATACLYIAGGSGALAHSNISGITFNGSSTSWGIEFNGQNGITVKECYFDTNAIGIVFHNKGVSTFTEYVVADGCDFSINCTQAARYKITSGNESFHGSGLRNCVLNTPSSPVIQIDSSAVVYNAPLSLQLWARSTNFTLIQNDSSFEAMFYGDLTFEIFTPTIVTLAGGNEVDFVGTVSAYGEGITYGTLLQSDAIVRNTDGTTSKRGTRTSSSIAMTTGANTIASKLNGYSRQVYLKLGASNYEYRYMLWVTHEGYGGAGDVTQLAEHLITNVTGYGAPTFTVSTSGQLIVTNANFPASGVTAYVDEFEFGQKMPGSKRIE